MSKSSEFEEEVEQIKSLGENRLRDLDDVVSQFKTIVPPLAIAWMKKTVEAARESNPEKVEGLDPEALRGLKAELEKLYDKIPQVTLEELGDRESWSHNLPWLSHWGGGAFRRRKHSQWLSNIYCSIVSRVGEVLEPHGLIDVGEYKTWARDGPGRFRYSITLGEPEVLDRLTTRYRELVTECENLEDRLDEAEKKRSAARAKELWDEA